VSRLCSNSSDMDDFSNDRGNTVCPGSMIYVHVLINVCTYYASVMWCSQSEVSQEVLFI